MREKMVALFNRKGSGTGITMSIQLVSDQEWSRMWFKEDIKRHRLSAIDKAIALKNLLNKKQYEKDYEIAEALGISKGMVSKNRAILKLSPTVSEYAQSHPGVLGISILYELHQLEKISTPEQTLEMAQAIVEGHAKRDDITKLRAKLASSKTRKPHDASRQDKVKKGETMKKWNGGRVVIDVKITIPECRQTFLDELGSGSGQAEYT